MRSEVLATLDSAAKTIDQVAAERRGCHRPAVHTVLAHHPTPRRAAAKLLKCGTWRLGFHAGEFDAIRASGTAAMGSAEVCRDRATC
jgi:hypothetical protein